MNPDARDVISELVNDSMCPQSVLTRLYELSRSASARQGGVIVEIGAYRGASAVALALGIRDGGRGHVHSIDPHREYTGVLGGRFSPADHAVFEATVARYGVRDRITHLCTDSESAARGWKQKVDLLWMDGDHSYEGVARDLDAWLPHLAADAYVVLDDHSPGSGVEAAVRDHLPFSRFQARERIGNTLVLQRTPIPRTLVLCGGMQSSGTTLVSMCFLQRDDMDGVYDLDNPLIQQDFSRVYTPMVWVKMTIGAFRLREIADLYSAQGWSVKPLFVHRDPEEALASLVTKWYGLDGCTGDDPPLHVRLARWRADLRDVEALHWPVLRYAELMSDAAKELARACELLQLPWDRRMFDWPKPITEFAYPGRGNESLRDALEPGSGLADAIARYRARAAATTGGAALPMSGMIGRLLGKAGGSLGPSRYSGTRRDRVDAELRGLRREISRLRRLEAHLDRLMRHAVIGTVIRWWTRLVNPALARPDPERAGEAKATIAGQQAGGQR